ncbi:accessory Sec system translocase SecA2 [Bacillus gaemokensis]|uniref:Protein translocase subunit SecA n=1 Tax=Bacillus gaemokensis TaxID=574375 RepID=A0A073K8P4_9BACI|nr:accessory Sec system translocase SecA2 [Bacillus gaemokensis]KEK22827.1 preprotein translocase subunit SecA [Bacillus gaemokensis]KYG30311.1 preprotein translocase subunit SecA [Bacillus gaemokensis]
MLNSFKKILGDSQKRKLKKYELLVDEINTLEPQIEALSDEALRQKTASFKDMLQNGKTVDDIKVEAFAVVREAAKRVLGLRHYDVQLIGGLVLLEGNIAEMPTGEGKTLVSSLAAYVRALEGKGVHVITINDYLATRDKELIGQVHEFLDLQVGLNTSSAEPIEKKRVYEADITYGTHAEFVFDYLRDNLKTSLSGQVQRPHHFAIIDEIDSVLMDEAKTPLIITEKKHSNSKLHSLCAKEIKAFQDTVHYTYDAETKSSNFTDEGIKKIEALFNIDNVYAIEHQSLYYCMIQALRAHVIFQRDVDYIVQNNKIIYIATFTEHTMDEHSLNDGLYQAIEAKEGLEITAENQIQAAITIQNFFRMYSTLSGMTGTARTEEKEFNHIYKMNVISIPTNRPIIREDAKDLVYMKADEKYKAIREEIMKRHEKGQPILIGTMSPLQSKMVARYLDDANLPYQLLHTTNLEQEADLIATAGQKGKITIATNMAGRGTSVLLGEDALELGGLHIIGTERHESRRADQQLKDQAGRQGAPGSSQFFLSLEDNMFQRFAQEELEKIKKTLKTDSTGLILSPKVHDFVNRIQLVREGVHASIREYNVKLDDVLNEQRHIIYALRNQFLHEKTTIIELITPMLEHIINSIAKKYLLEGMVPEEWNFTSLIEELQSVMPTEELPLLSANTVHSIEELHNLLTDSLANHLNNVQALHDDTALHHAFCQMGIHLLDQNWINHLDAMHNCKKSIELKPYQEEEPAHMYQREGLKIFLYTYSNFEKEMCIYIAQHVAIPQDA